jgi:hypothetical protein
MKIAVMLAGFLAGYLGREWWGERRSEFAVWAISLTAFACALALLIILMTH